MIEVGSKKYPWQEGMTVTSLLEILEEKYPYSVVRINDKVVCGPDFNKTLIPDHAKIFLIPLVAGG